MACVNPDGTITLVARQVLGSLAVGGTVEEAAKSASLPVYRVRASLRELVAAGLVAVDDGSFALTDEGRRVLAA